MVKIEKENSADTGATELGSKEYYPYGTSLMFEDDMVDKLGLNSCDVGDTVEVRAMAKVTSKDEREQEGEGKKKTVSLQLVEVSTDKEGSKEGGFDRASTLYGSM